MAKTAKIAASSTASSTAARVAASFLQGLGAAALLLTLASLRRTSTALDYDLVAAKCSQALNGAGAGATSSVRGGGGGGGGGGYGGGGGGGGGLAVATLPATKSNVDHLVTKRFGAGWEVWDRKSVLHKEFGDAGAGGTPCHWQEYKEFGRGSTSNGAGGGTADDSSTSASASASSSGVAPVFMCLYPPEQDRFVSGQIQKRDCHTLTQRLQDGGDDAASGTKNLVYMDVGANIGACVVQILSTTDAKVLAFESNPKNLFRLTSTLMNLPEEMKNRVTLFPVSLGSEPSGSATIVADPRNAGNTRMVRAAAAASASTFTGGAANEKGVPGATVATHNIPVERMDDLLSKDLKVDLLRLDVQGFECFVLSGMRSVLANTRKMFFEVEEEQLTRFRDPGRSCSGALLVQTLQRAGFAVHKPSGAPAEDLPSTSDADLAGSTYRNQDLVAERPMTKA
jgi:FkbM family methyltransferase